jgi:hypothetical protein
MELKAWEARIITRIAARVKISGAHPGFEISIACWYFTLIDSLSHGLGIWAYISWDYLEAERKLINFN